MAEFVDTPGNTHLYRKIVSWSSPDPFRKTSMCWNESSFPLKNPELSKYSMKCVLIRVFGQSSSSCRYFIVAPKTDTPALGRRYLVNTVTIRPSSWPSMTFVPFPNSSSKSKDRLVEWRSIDDTCCKSVIVDLVWTRCLERTYTYHEARALYRHGFPTSKWALIERKRSIPAIYPSKDSISRADDRFFCWYIAAYMSQENNQGNLFQIYFGLSVMLLHVVGSTRFSWTICAWNQFNFFTLNCGRLLAVIMDTTSQYQFVCRWEWMFRHTAHGWGAARFLYEWHSRVWARV